MHFFVVAASGFIGKHVVAGLLEAGHRVTGTSRDPDGLARAFPSIRTVKADLGRTSVAEWQAALQGVDVVVNVAGQLNHDLRAVHVDGPATLYRAAAAAGVGRIVLISAISARADVDTDYARTKLEGEAILRGSDVPWTILRPSMVIAKGSFGGSSVLRGLAGLPLITPVLSLGNARFSPIHARDLAEVVHRVAVDPQFAGATLEPSGAQSCSLDELVTAYRRWLGFRPAMKLPIPAGLMNPVAQVGEWFGGPIATTTLKQLEAGNAGDAAAFARTVGYAPRGLSTVLEAEPAEVQDRWHARLFFLAIAVRASLIFLWLASATAGLFFGHAYAGAFAAGLGLPAEIVTPLVVVTVATDLVAAALLFTRRTRLALLVQLALVLGYTIGLTLVLPGLWADPFGALLKNIPILALIGVNAVLSEPR